MSNQSPLTLANIRERIKKQLNEDNYLTRLLATVEEKTKINREYLAYGKFSNLKRISNRSTFERFNLKIIRYACLRPD